MHPKYADLQTPWLRAQLIDWLVKLSNRGWQEQNWVSTDTGDPSLDDALNFFDDTGVLEEPQGRLGFILIDEKEALAMQALNVVLDREISAPSSCDAEIIHRQTWDDVVEAARGALIAMGEKLQ